MESSEDGSPTDRRYFPNKDTSQEIPGNTLEHLHLHLFPGWINDAFWLQATSHRGATAFTCGNRRRVGDANCCLYRTVESVRSRRNTFVEGSTTDSVLECAQPTDSVGYL